MSIVYKETKVIQTDKVRELYLDAGWMAYTEKENIINSIIPNALQVISAWEGEELVGLIRTVGDGVYIMYVQDILVKKAYQGRGIGSHLLQTVLSGNKQIPQKVLMTEDTEKTIKFYEKNGFTKVNGKETGVAFSRYDR